MAKKIKSGSNIYQYMYQRLEQNPSNFHNWFDKVKDCGFYVPDSTSIPVPEAVMKAFSLRDPERNYDLIEKWVQIKVMPVFQKHKSTFGVFLKNGTFANKSNAMDCILPLNSSAGSITQHIININYLSFMFGVGGNTEVVIRNMIPWNSYKTATIYNGLPLHPEIRVFYDFDSHKVCYSANYWDWDSCYSKISRRATDRIVYQACYEQIKEAFDSKHEEAEKLVEEYLKKVTGLSGVWAIDLLLDEENKFWLIDMSIGHEVAYYDQKKIKIKN